VLAEREAQPLGAATSEPVDVRVVSATSHDLEAQVVAGRFRKDLYYRLSGIVLEVPPLRERPEDVVPLVAHFLTRHARRLGQAPQTVTPRALELLQRHPWPGNVRELESVIERALILGTGQALDVADLPDGLRSPRVSVPSPAGPLRPLAEVEREHIARVLAAADGNKARAARILGLDRKTLYRKLTACG
jgi:DNA-binding NtrC family response regulator